MYIQTCTCIHVHVPVCSTTLTLNNISCHKPYYIYLLHTESVTQSFLIPGWPIAHHVINKNPTRSINLFHHLHFKKKHYMHILYLQRQTTNDTTIIHTCRQGCQHWMRVRNEKCEGCPLPAYKVAQVPKKLMSGGGGGGLRRFFFRPQNFCLDFAGTYSRGTLRTSQTSDKQRENVVKCARLTLNA